VQKKEKTCRISSKIKVTIQMISMISLTSITG